MAYVSTYASGDIDAYWRDSIGSVIVRIGGTSVGIHLTADEARALSESLLVAVAESLADMAVAK